MDIFLRRIMLYGIVGLSIMIAVTSIRMSINSSNPFVVPVNNNILIMGHSHTECAINDAILDRAINLSRSGRPLIASCNFINKITKDNPQIDTVLLAVNADLISRDWNRVPMWRMNKDISNSILFLGEVYQDVNYLLKNVLRVFNLLCDGCCIWDNNISGAYRYIDRDRLQLDMELQKDKLPIKADIDTTLYEYQKLLATKNLLDLRGVHLILVDTPKYNPENQIIEQIKFHALVQEYLSEFDYIDYVSFPLSDNCYRDITHLNYKGAELFSQYLQENGIVKYNSNN